MDALFLVVVILLVCFSVIWLYGLGDQSLSHLPAPKGWPVIGNALQVNSKRPDLTFTEWEQQLGDVFVVRMFNKSFVVLNSFDAIYEALILKGAQFAGRPQEKNFREQFITDNYQDFVMCNPTARWKLTRKTVHRQIKMYDTGLKRIEEINNSIIQELVHAFRRHIGKPYNPEVAIFNTTMNITAMLLANKKYNTTDKEFKLILEILDIMASTLVTAGEGSELDVFPFLRYFGNRSFKKLRRLYSNMEKIWSTMKKETITKVVTPEDGYAGQSVVDALLQLLQEQKDNSDVRLQEVHLKQACQNLLAAGTYTTASTFYAFLNLLSQHTEVQSKLQAEVDEVVGPSRVVSLGDRHSMPYTRATVLEMLRFSSVAPLNLPHATLEETTIQGKALPAGVTVITNLWALHHDDKFWNCPYEFRPERFLDANGQLVSASHENRRHLMPFSAGPRVCIGEVLAQGRLFQLTATTAQLFTVMQGPEKVSCDPRKYKSGVALSSESFEIILASRNNHLFE